MTEQDHDQEQETSALRRRICLKFVLYLAVSLVNPMLTGNQSLKGYRWSSYLSYFVPAAKRPRWLRVERVLGSVGIEGSLDNGQRSDWKWGMKRVRRW